MKLLLLCLSGVAARDATTHETLGLPMTLTNYIDGEFREAGTTEANRNPATGEVIGQVAVSSRADVEEAISVAKKAQDVWGSYPVQARARVLEELADRLEAKAELFSKAESVDMGKVLASSAGDDLKRQVRNLRYHAATAVADRPVSSLVETDRTFEQRPGDDAPQRHFLNYASRYPIGVVGIIAHWSRPLHQTVWRLAPALACGNAVIVKAPTVTPLTTFALAQVIDDLVKAGKIPAGVVNFVFGSGEVVGQTLASHRAVGAVAMVGGNTAAAKIQLAAAAAGSMKKLKFDVGNNHAVVVDEAADLDALLPVAVTAAFKCDAGQRAHSTQTLVLHAAIADAFLDKFLPAVRALTVGDPLDVSIDVGPLVSKDQVTLMRQGLDALVAAGGKILVGGIENATLPPSADLAGGNWFRPTVVGPFTYERKQGDCRRGCGADDGGDYDYDQGKPWADEHQGPIVKIVVVPDIETAIHAANAGPYGLSASVWSQNIDTAHAVAHAIDAGYVWVNNWLARDLAMPFGGWKESGNGQRSGGSWDLDFYSYTKTTSIELRQNRHDLTDKNFYVAATA
eukprot:CAMPEP_0197388138 /NCGR_PEP_ID=MMETSP1165-20131217/907_1 /TAXON_ID=284809 /ORGANISM="Chrysocystis fragilis, Strain CCMP3189" /LENGTH=568 /DNA_ID=CAMNT_0042913479 /DNA_START=33 /DNA_END=1739 /DNA_ORIENTATION=+